MAKNEYWYDNNTRTLTLRFFGSLCGARRRTAVDDASRQRAVGRLLVQSARYEFGHLRHDGVVEAIQGGHAACPALGDRASFVSYNKNLAQTAAGRS